MPLTRRSLLAATGAGVLLSACGEDERMTASTQDAPQPQRHDYGTDSSQFGELSLPSGTPRGVVVVIHGGFWRAAYDLDLGRPLAASLVEQGWAAWNVEYRRVGNGGGTPQTFDDVAAAIDLLADLDLGMDPARSPVVTLGHSAGGHLAVWAAGRPAPGVRVSAAISQAGVVDLVGASSQRLGDGAVEALLGHPATTADAAFDPLQQVPLDVPVVCVHGVDDAIVPISQSRSYVETARAAGADADLVEVDGDHFVVIDPGSEAWRAQLEVLDRFG